MTWAEKFWIMFAMWFFEFGATFYWKRRARRLEDRIAESWINYLSPLKRDRGDK